jgi:DNA-binding Lrp family transcriptional regulator
MKIIADPVDRALLDDWQRDLPITSRPFNTLAEALGQSEQSVVERLSRMLRAGRISRVGATCAPNTISASTLAAVAAPIEQVDEIAAIIGEEPGVNHSYHREDVWNLWFVVTGPDRAFVDAALTRISDRTGLRVLDLRLMRPFNVDLGFRMSGTDGPGMPPKPRAIDLTAVQSGDAEILQALSRGLSIVPQPFAALATELGRPEADVLNRIKTLADAGIISRLGVIVRHRALGWRSNAMVVWDIEPDRIEAAGPVLAAQTGVTLCYERRPVQGIWPYRLYCMIHARSRDEALSHLTAAEALPELADVPHKVLFSTRCFKQTGALISREKERAA